MTFLSVSLCCELCLAYVHVWTALAEADSRADAFRSSDLIFLCLSLIASCITFGVNVIGIRVVLRFMTTRLRRLVPVRHDSDVTRGGGGSGGAAEEASAAVSGAGVSPASE